MASESKWTLARQGTNTKMDVLSAFDQAARMSKFRRNAEDAGVSGAHSQEELDEIVAEPVGAAHRHRSVTIRAAGEAISKKLAELIGVDGTVLRQQRREARHFY